MSFLKVRERLEEDPAFAAVTVESERIRLFNEHVGSLEVSRQVALSNYLIYLSGMVGEIFNWYTVSALFIAQAWFIHIT